MGVAKEWEPWNWDLWNMPQEPDDDEASLELLRQKLDRALKAGREGDIEPQGVHDCDEVAGAPTTQENQGEKGNLGR